MPRVTPRQVVELISKLFPEVDTELEGQPFSLHRHHSGRCSALLDLIEKIPTELLVIDSSQYVEFVSSVATIRDARSVQPDQRGEARAEQHGE
jgi:hypothetical protein